MQHVSREPATRNAGGAGMKPSSSVGGDHAGRYASKSSGVITNESGGRAALLAATRARVDPTRLRATLARVDALYDAEPAQADALLGTLVAELRAAIPR